MVLCAFNIIKMAEIKKEVKTYKTEYVCDECGIGTMESCSGIVLTSNPPRYPHKCTNCGCERHFTGTKYPVIYCE
jgi:transcription elongation factor Elf1